MRSSTTGTTTGTGSTTRSRSRTSSALGVLAALALTVPLATGCSGSGGSSSQPKITLRIGLFGTFGYKQAGLYKEYEKQHPNIHIVEDDTELEATYWKNLTKKLNAGKPVDDIQGVEIGHIAAAVQDYPDKFLDLNSLGASALRTDYQAWKWQTATTKGGKTIGLGTDLGPTAICYRADLLKKAGIASTPAQFEDELSSWDAYVQLGKKYEQNAPSGSHWEDSAGGLFQISSAPSTTLYTASSGQLIWNTNPAVKDAWNLAVESIKYNESAKLKQFTPAWNKGFSNGAFATVGCPAWMMTYIQSQAPKASGEWNVVEAPGATGNWGGSWLTIPASSKHPKAAFDLIKWLTAGPQEKKVFKAAGNYPSNIQGQAALAGEKSAYFQNAKIGQLFQSAAKLLPVQAQGPYDADIKQAITDSLLNVETKGTDPDKAWKGLKKTIDGIVHTKP